MPPSRHDFLVELDAQIARAAAQGRPHLEVNAGEFHRCLGGYPPPTGENHAMPNCCGALWQEYDPATDEIVKKPPSGQGASLTIRYKLPRKSALLKEPSVQLRHGARPGEMEIREDGEWKRQ